MKQKTINVIFGEGMRVDADFGNMIVPTDQSAKEGGTGSAPSPFDLFLASIVTCAGIYARRFCETRALSTQGLAVRMVCDLAEKNFRIERMTLELTLPEGLPEEYKAPLVRAVALCTVKKHIVDPPEFVITTICQETP